MTCTVPEADRKTYVQRIVRLAILEVDGRTPPRTVTQDTALGNLGLGHAPNKRMRYRDAIRKGLAEKGCAMRTLTPNSFADAKLVRVRDVTDMVLGDLE